MFHHRRETSKSGGKEKDKDKDEKKTRKEKQKEKETEKGSSGKKAEVKIAYEVVVKGIDQLKPDDNGKKIQVTWKRGRKSANRGKTKPETVKYNFVQWDEKININSTLLQDPATKEFEHKNIDFEVVLLSGPKFNKKEKMGKVTLNLASYAFSSAPASGGDSSSPKPWSNAESLQLPIQNDTMRKKEDTGKGRIDWNRVNSPTLLLSIKSRWLKYDGKLLVLKGQAKETKDGKERASVEVGGVAYDLQTDVGSDGDGEDDTTLGGDGSGESDEEDWEMDSDGSEAESDSGKKSDMSSSSGGSKDKTKALSDETEKLKQQLRKANETAALRLETISSQKRQLEQLKGGGGSNGDKSAAGGIPGGDDAASQIILMIGQAYKKTRNDPDDQCYWLAFSCNLLDMFCKAAATDDNSPASAVSSLPDLPHDGVQFTGAPLSTEGLKQLTGSVRVAKILESITRDMFTGLIKAYCVELDKVLIAVILEQQEDLDTLELISMGRKGKAFPVTFTWRLTEMIDLMKANRFFPSMQKQFVSRVYYFINARLFNALLKEPELCTVGFGLRLKYAISELINWLKTNMSEEEGEEYRHYPRTAAKYLNHVKDAANLLVLSKNYFEEESLSNLAVTFPSLSLFVIKQLLDSFLPDEMSSERISNSVKRKLESAVSKAAKKDAPMTLDPFDFPGEEELKDSKKGGGKDKKKSK